MFGIGPMELMAILVVALLVFGPKRIPELARTVGRGLAEFRRASNDLRQSLALDELQRDLRQDLSPNKTIHRPEDRPAQAGDDVEASDESVAPADQESAQSAGSSEPGASDRHSGELPLGAEHETEHHGVDDTSDGSDVSDVSDVSDASDANLAKEPQHTNRPADSELGNIPVAGGKPADTSRG